MTNFLQHARAALATELERFRNRHFLEAAMAASALVATADGAVDFGELNVIDQALEAVRELNIYDPHKAVNIYRDHIDDLLRDPEPARARALQAIGRIAGDERAAGILVKVCVAIAKSDDDFTASEQDAVREICGALGVDAAEMGIR